MDDVETSLRERVKELEGQLGILRESDGREARLGVTAPRVEELREMARTAPPDARGEALRDAVRFYDLVRKAWEGSREEYDELRARVDTAITWLVTVDPNLPASIIAGRARLALEALREMQTTERMRDDEWAPFDPERSQGAMTKP